MEQYEQVFDILVYLLMSSVFKLRYSSIFLSITIEFLDFFCLFLMTEKLVMLFTYSIIKLNKSEITTGS